MASRNVDTALTFIRATFKNDYETLLPLVGEGFVLIDHSEGRSYRTDEEHAAAMEADVAWADRRFHLTHAMETVDGAVVLQYVEHATQVGSFHGIEPTGNVITADVCNIFRFDRRPTTFNTWSFESDARRAACRHRWRSSASRGCSSTWCSPGNTRSTS